MSAFNKTLISLDIGPLYSKVFAYDPDFARFNLFENTFDVSGFSMFTGADFTLTPDPDNGGQPSAVPLPASALMLLSGFAMLFVGNRRRRRRRISELGLA